MIKVLCRVSGGVTGTREAYLKDAQGTERRFDTMQEAEAEATSLTQKMNSNPHRTADFRYRAVECDW